MSMSGQRRLELERERVEALRLEQVRGECSSLLESCEEALRQVRDVATQQLAAAELRASADALRELRSQITGAPDAARSSLLDVAGQIHGAVARAEARAQAWSTGQAQAVADARQAQTLAAMAGERPDAEALRLGAEAAAAAVRDDLPAAARLSDLAREAAMKASALALDERVRREVVKGLLRTLKDLGFITIGPQLDSGVVVLEGRLASGRRARFEVSLDGNMEFDLDGYEGRTCADDMEKVETTLRDRFGVKLGPPQVVWKNPDRISKGARDLPRDDTRKR
jgi:hypothetical protein